MVQLTSPVLWENTLEELLKRGLERSFEIGPKQSLLQAS